MALRDSEVAVIGSLMIDARCAVEIDRTGISAEDFDDAVMKLAFEVVEDLRAAGKTVDPILVADEMARRRPGDYTDALMGCMAFTTTAANMNLYCEQVKDNAQRRKFLDAVLSATSLADYGDWRAGADAIFEMLRQFKGVEHDLIPGSVLAEDFLSYYEATKEDPEAAYCKTGFPDLDRQLGGGMFRSEVYIIGARPGMGKTTLGINIAQNIVRRGKAVLFVSLEMSEPQIQAKRIALETGLKYTDIMTGRLNAEDESKMRLWISGQKNQPFYLTTKSLTVGEIGRKARQIQNLDCIIVDYIGLISCPEDSRQKPRYEQMTEISAALKAMAKMLKIPILALSQLNRENTNRKDKRPTMADLRDSGAIEQDAGGIILLHRPDYYETREAGTEAPEVEEIELDIAKNRHAEPGLVRMWWHGNTGTVTMKTKEDREAPAKVKEGDDLPF